MLKKLPLPKRFAAQAQSAIAAPKAAPSNAERIVDLLGAPGVLGVKLSKDFMELRAWWPLLIPLMIWEARRTYQRERQRSQRLRAARLLQGNSNQRVKR